MANSRGLKIAVAAVAVGLAAAGGLLALGHRGPRLAPDFAAPDLAGHAVRLSALRGKVVVLNLWATWCPPCREEMPSMERLYGQLRDRDFQLGITFPVLIDPERQVGERYGVWGYPETFIIDRNGYVVERVIGPRDWATPAQLAALEALIAADGDGANASAPRGPS